MKDRDLRLFSAIILAILVSIFCEEQSQGLNYLEDLAINNQCYIPKLPETFAIFTVTRLRVKDNDVEYAINFFKDFLNYYTAMECPQL